MDATKDLILGEIKELAGIDAEQLLEMGLLTTDHAKKWVVKKRYFQMAKTGRTYTDIKNELSDCFGMSVSTIEKLVYRRQRA
jgi:hypothetical protein